jgi:hypothetical protein
VVLSKVNRAPSFEPTLDIDIEQPDGLPQSERWRFLIRFTVLLAIVLSEHDETSGLDGYHS